MALDWVIRAHIGSDAVGPFMVAPCFPWPMHIITLGGLPGVCDVFPSMGASFFPWPKCVTLDGPLGLCDVFCLWPLPFFFVAQVRYA